MRYECDPTNEWVLEYYKFLKSIPIAEPSGLVYPRFFTIFDNYVMSYQCGFGNNGDYVGEIYMVYEMRQLTQLFEPLYEGLNNLSIWGFVNTYDYQTHEVKLPSFDEAIFQKGPEQYIDPEVFQQLIEDIYEPEVVKTAVNGKN